VSAAAALLPMVLGSTMLTMPMVRRRLARHATSEKTDPFPHGEGAGLRDPV
jgi:hypothetical protein